MWPRKIIGQLFLSYLMIMGLPVLIVTWYMYRSFDEFYMSGTVEDLKSRAYLMGSQVEEHLGYSSTEGIDSLCKIMSHHVMTRFTVIAPSGKVIGDSEKNPDSLENHANRTEIIAAMSGNIGMSRRYSFTMQRDMIYVAIPVYVSGKIAAVVRTSLPQKVINSAIRKFYSKIAWVSVLTAILAAFTSYWLSQKISRPIKSMQIGSRRFAAGDFSEKLPISGYEEADQLAYSLNEMAHKLSETIDQITSRKNELDAILSSMSEGVVAIDSNEKIIIANRAAALLFGIDEKSAQGKWIGEVFRNSEIHDFIVSSILSDKPSESEISFISEVSGEERFFQLHGSALRNASNKGIGAIMVVNDITQIKRLDMVRKDFVANVSHELRTPLTSIKGFVETLLSGAMNNPEEAKRFLNILSTQAERLNSIVEDLLALSKIEFDAGRNAIDFTEGSITGVVDSAVEACSMKASGKNITIEKKYSQGVTASRIERSLVEQAVINLIENAINYSEENKHIWMDVQIAENGKEIIISVKDEGSGIAKEHLSRIFERFYRVDKARSRKVGGTGLGLSIVKHIMIAHGGRVEVESTPGKGSIFSLYIPA
jgi:two-component system, OmpR family, phosphate regulon sensor histidine kinase PhoR